MLYIITCCNFAELPDSSPNGETLIKPLTRNELHLNSKTQEKMNNISTTTIIAVCAFLFIKLYYENKKLKSKLFNNEDQPVDEDMNHTESQNEHNGVQDISIDEKKINPETPSRNSFLYGAEDFGTMEKGVVINGKTYIYENEKGDSFKIQPPPKKKEK